MSDNQNELRNLVKKRFGIKQKQACVEIPIEKVYFNKWLNNKLNLGERKIQDIKQWLNDE